MAARLHAGRLKIYPECERKALFLLGKNAQQQGLFKQASDYFREALLYCPKTIEQQEDKHQEEKNNNKTIEFPSTNTGEKENYTYLTQKLGTSLVLIPSRTTVSFELLRACLAGVTDHASSDHTLCQRAIHVWDSFSSAQRKQFIEISCASRTDHLIDDWLEQVVLPLARCYEIVANHASASQKVEHFQTALRFIEHFIVQLEDGSANASSIYHVRLARYRAKLHALTFNYQFTQKSLKLFEHALQVASHRKDEFIPQQAKIHLDMANVYAHHDDTMQHREMLNHAVVHCMQASRLYQLVSDFRNEAVCYLNAANYIEQIHSTDRARALPLLKDALSIGKQLNDADICNQALTRLIYTHNDERHLHAALTYQRELAFRMSMQPQQDAYVVALNEVANRLIQLGDIEGAANQLDQALQVVFPSLNTQLDSGEPRFVQRQNELQALVFCSFSYLYLLLGDMESCAAFTFSALELLEYDQYVEKALCAADHQSHDDDDDDDKNEKPSLNKIPLDAQTTRTLIRLLHNYALYLVSTRGEKAQAKAIILQAIDFARTTQSKSLQAMCLVTLGHIETEYRNFSKAVQHISEAFDLCVSLPHASEHTQRALGFLGRSFMYDAKPEKALLQFKQQMKIATKNNDKWARAAVLQNLAFLQLSSRKFEQALDLFQKHIPQAIELQQFNAAQVSISSCKQIAQWISQAAKQHNMPSPKLLDETFEMNAEKVEKHVQQSHHP
eukprot:CAMPEP_0201550452 /NCGR_PEP_ID=MMETSP0173_2-20130828/6805_1 /ASSEMBLY_ACC=CAM_ASM_000268 /TAXON_ID=218659 /ORGANISM="Vexillifera sp., Strain DIVA3 564/2" /LENGTH=729 /DNA_ID=CAMNT_0047960421 /DNA_START=1933 /DNA_END=4119 /DNA_ORIENTATION=-